MIAEIMVRHGSQWAVIRAKRNEWNGEFSAKITRGHRELRNVLQVRYGPDIEDARKDLHLILILQNLMRDGWDAEIKTLKGYLLVADEVLPPGSD
jgi:hypothetical protein